jgi:hypothetical protein
MWGMLTLVTVVMNTMSVAGWARRNAMRFEWTLARLVPPLSRLWV